VGRKQNKQLNKENKDAQIVAFLMLEYTETSVGAYDKNLIKDDLYKSNTPVNGALVQKHSENDWRSLKNNLEVIMHYRESAHMYTYDWEKQKYIQTVQSEESWNGFYNSSRLLSLSPSQIRGGCNLHAESAPAYV